MPSLRNIASRLSSQRRSVILAFPSQKDTCLQFPLNSGMWSEIALTLILVGDRRKCCAGAVSYDMYDLDVWEGGGGWFRGGGCWRGGAEGDELLAVFRIELACGRSPVLGVSNGGISCGWGISKLTDRRVVFCRGSLELLGVSVGVWNLTSLAKRFGVVVLFGNRAGPCAARPERLGLSTLANDSVIDIITGNKPGYQNKKWNTTNTLRTYTHSVKYNRTN